MSATGAQKLKTNMKPRHYCDYNATSPLRDRAREAMLLAMQLDGNPSSIHTEGRAARRLVEDARRSISEAVGLPKHVVVFTSGATEALATLLQPGVRNTGSKKAVARLVICASEHVAALEAHTLPTVEMIGVDGSGLINLNHLRAALSDTELAAETIVCVQGANNETGVCQPLEKIEDMAASSGALFVSDMVQWVGRRPIGAASPDAIVLSAHKLGGPAGVGALLYNPAKLSIERGLIRGGGQEKGARAGTENRVGIVGFGAALQDAVQTMPKDMERIETLRTHFESKLLAQRPDAKIFGSAAPRLANTSCFALEGMSAATALMRFDLDGIALSSGAACSSGKVQPSHVLSAMDIPPDLAQGALRISFGFGSQEGDVEAVLASVKAWS